MKRPVFLGVAFLVFLALATVVVFLSSDPAVEADNTEMLQRFQTKLETRGINVASIRIDGDRVAVDRELTGEYGIEDEVAKWAAYRAAAEEGFSWLDLRTKGQEAYEGFRLRLLTVSHAPPGDASKAVASWVADVEAKTGAKAESSYRDYRLDLVVEGPREAAPAAAEHFMMGGVVQHEGGNIDILTIVVRSDGETVFEGVADYVVGVQARLYQAPNMSFSW